MAHRPPSSGIWVLRDQQVRNLNVAHRPAAPAIGRGVGVPR